MTTLLHVYLDSCQLIYLSTYPPTYLSNYLPVSLHTRPHSYWSSYSPTWLQNYLPFLLNYPHILYTYRTTYLLTYPITHLLKLFQSRTLYLIWHHSKTPPPSKQVITTKTTQEENHILGEIYGTQLTSILTFSIIIAVRFDGCQVCWRHIVIAISGS